MFEQGHALCRRTRNHLLGTLARALQEEGSMMQNQSDDRLARERDFHNDRFGAVEARKEDTFYFAA